MHPENKLTSHGKLVTSVSQSHIPNVTQQEQQGPRSNLGSNGSRPAHHEVKANQISQGNPGLKSVGQLGSNIGVGGMMAKRKRSISMDAGDQKDTISSVVESDSKVEGMIRSKRRCALKKKQPYSGDEWCSGAETEEEELKPPSSRHRELVISCPGQSLSAAVSEQCRPSLVCGLGPELKSEQLSQHSQQMVYVFTTNLANSAAEAVMHGHTDSILLFHQKNVSCSKLNQKCTGVEKLPNLSVQPSRNSTPTMGTPKSQSGTSRPASVSGIIVRQPADRSTPSSTGHPEGEVTQAHPEKTHSHRNSVTTHSLGSAGSSPHRIETQGCGVDLGRSLGTINYPVSPSVSPSMFSAHLRKESPNRLSKDQLEHREHCLQTLRDFEKLFLRTGAGDGCRDPGGLNNNLNNGSINSNIHGCRGLNNRENNSVKASNSALSPCVHPIHVMKRLEPLQSMISQTQNISGPVKHDALMVRHHGLPPYHHLSSPSGLDLSPTLGPDGLTPEQIAWRKLQEEYYQEKQRRQEINPHTPSQFLHMMPEIGIPGVPHLMMRGPPPPYHSKSGMQQWEPRPLNGGGMGRNFRMRTMHQDVPQEHRFHGQLQRGPPGSVYLGSPDGILPTEGLGLERSPRPGIGWLDDMAPNVGEGGQFYGCCLSGGAVGPSQQIQSSLDHPLSREEMFHIMEKRQLQGLRQIELEQLSRQGGFGGSRIMGNCGLGISNPGMEVELPSRSGTLNFLRSRAMTGSPNSGADVGGGSLMSDTDSVLNMNTSININLHNKHQILAQKLRQGPEIVSPEDNSCIRPTENGRVGASKVEVSGADVPHQFHSQVSFPEGQVDGLYIQQSGSVIFGPDQQGPPQTGETSRLSHMPMYTSQKEADLGSRHPSDLSINANPVGSPALLSHQLKSPSLTQEPSALVHSPSASGLKSPNQLPSTGPPHLPLPAASGTATPTTISMKSPQVKDSPLGLQSPSGSPGHFKPSASPRWTTSPQTSLTNSGGASSSKGVSNKGSSSSETAMSLPPRSSNSTPNLLSQPSNMHFTSSPDTPPSQNPLSLIMSQMSKYAMPTTTPIYHDAIKTIATSDDDMPPDRLLIPGANIQGNMVNYPSTQILHSSQGSIGSHSGPQSPAGIALQESQTLLFDTPNPMSMPAMMGGEVGPPNGIEPCSLSPMHTSNQMGGFSHMQATLNSPIREMGQQYNLPSEEIQPAEQMHLLSKAMPHQHLSQLSNSFSSIPMTESPDLSEVIRPTHTGIPEFDLSRIIPADKPSSTLQYFPKSEAISQLQQTPHQQQLPKQATSAQLLKQLSRVPHSSPPSSNPHIANLQNMMAEQQLPLQPAHCGLRPVIGLTQGGSRGLNTGDGMGTVSICHPGHLISRTGFPQQQPIHHQQQQQAMMTNSLLQHQSYQTQGTMPPQQHPHNLIVQQNMMMIQTKQRGMAIPGEHFGQQGALMSPQGPRIESPHPQLVLMGSKGIRQRGLSLDSTLGYGAGSMANMPF